MDLPALWQTAPRAAGVLVLLGVAIVSSRMLLDGPEPPRSMAATSGAVLTAPATPDISGWRIQPKEVAPVSLPPQLTAAPAPEGEVDVIPRPPATPGFAPSGAPQVERALAAPAAAAPSPAAPRDVSPAPAQTNSTQPETAQTPAAQTPEAQTPAAQTVTGANQVALASRNSQAEALAREAVAREAARQSFAWTEEAEKCPRTWITSGAQTTPDPKLACHEFNGPVQALAAPPALEAAAEAAAPAEAARLPLARPSEPPKLAEAPKPGSGSRAARSSRQGLGPPPNCGTKRAKWRYTDRKRGTRAWYCK